MTTFSDQPDDLAVVLLGRLSVQRNGAPVDKFESGSVSALLAYIACQPGVAVRRDYAAALLYPDSPNARANLRQAIYNLRQRLGDVIETTAQTVMFSADYRTAVDVVRLLDLLEQPTPAILDLYTAPLLANAAIAAALPFEEWLLQARESLHRRVMDALAQLADQHAASGDHALAARLAARQVALDPWRESAVAQWIRSLVAQGKRAEALVAFQQLAQRLADELGVAPTERLRHIAEQLRQPPTALPTDDTYFVGRSAELAQLHKLLQQARLITLVGAGGMGKTRLAQALARQVGAAVWVDLAEVSAETPDTVLHAIADALDLPANATLPDIIANLPNALLILDNFEHLLDQRNIVVELLQTCQIVVTSRERLDVRGERLFDVGGMPLEDGETLFVGVARRLGVAVRTEAEREAVRRICLRVRGMPLAIELAARWVRTLAPQEIERELARGLEILATQSADFSPRHRTLRSVLNTAWARLNPDQRQTWATLALLPAGFTRDIAAAVTGATFWTLEGLIEQSLLQREGERYRFHPVVRQYGVEQSAENAWQPIAAHYLTRIQSIHATHDAHNALRQFQTFAIANLHAVWRWLIENRDFADLKTLHDCLFELYKLRQQYSQVVAWYDWTLPRIGQEPAVDPELRANLFRASGFFRMQLGDYPTALDDVMHAHTIAIQHDLRGEIGLALQLRGIIAYYQADMPLARELLLQALDALDEPTRVQRVSNSLAITEFTLGAYQSAETHARRAIALAQRRNDQLAEATYRGTLGNVLWAVERYDDALHQFEAALAIQRALDNPVGMAVSLRSIGETYDKIGRSHDAIPLKQEALHIDRDLHHHWNIGYGLYSLGESYRLLERWREARRTFGEAIAFAVQHDMPFHAAASAGSLGLIALAHGQDEEAAQLLAVGAAHEGLFDYLYDAYEAGLQQLAQRVAPDVIAATRERASDEPLFNLVLAYGS